MSADNVLNEVDTGKLGIEEKNWKRASQITLASSEEDLGEIQEEDSDEELSNDDTASSSYSINGQEKIQGRGDLFLNDFQS